MAGALRGYTQLPSDDFAFFAGNNAASEPFILALPLAAVRGIKAA